MYAVTGYLYKNDKLLLRGMWEDLEIFVEESKKINPKFVIISNIILVKSTLYSIVFLFLLIKNYN